VFLLRMDELQSGLLLELENALCQSRSGDSADARPPGDWARISPTR
jgi:hypothetical protein